MPDPASARLRPIAPISLSFPTSRFTINPKARLKGCLNVTDNGYLTDRIAAHLLTTSIHGIRAKARVGPPVPFPSFIGMQKMVAPDGGSLSALAIFSKPGLLPPSQI